MLHPLPRAIGVLLLFALLALVGSLSIKISNFESDHSGATTMLRITRASGGEVVVVQASDQSFGSFLTDAKRIMDGQNPVLVPKVSEPWTDRRGNVIELTEHPTTQDTQQTLCDRYDRKLAIAQSEFPCTD